MNRIKLAISASLLLAIALGSCYFLDDPLDVPLKVLEINDPGQAGTLYIDGQAQDFSGAASLILRGDEAKDRRISFTPSEDYLFYGYEVFPKPNFGGKSQLVMQSGFVASSLGSYIGVSVSCDPISDSGDEDDQAPCTIQAIPGSPSFFFGLRYTEPSCYTVNPKESATAIACQNPKLSRDAFIISGTNGLLGLQAIEERDDSNQYNHWQYVQYELAPLEESISYSLYEYAGNNLSHSYIYFPAHDQVWRLDQLHIKTLARLNMETHQWESIEFSVKGLVPDSVDCVYYEYSPGSTKIWASAAILDKDYPIFLLIDLDHNILHGFKPSLKDDEYPSAWIWGVDPSDNSLIYQTYEYTAFHILSPSGEDRTFDTLLGVRYLCSYSETELLCSVDKNLYAWSPSTDLICQKPTLLGELESDMIEKASWNPVSKVFAYSYYNYGPYKTYSVLLDIDSKISRYVSF